MDLRKESYLITFEATGGTTLRLRTPVSQIRQQGPRFISVCPEDMEVGVVAFGYGDGYPRNLPAGTPVRLRDARVPVVGRVSMDMITVDLRTVPGARAGDRVVLWGDGLPVEEIAALAGTIPYELMCRVTDRVPRVRVDEVTDRGAA